MFSKCCHTVVLAMADRTGDLTVLEKLRSSSPNLLFIIERSKNLNVVCYEGIVEEKSFKDAAPVDVYWQDIDPAYVEKARAKGVTTDRTELNYLEKKMAYGVSATAVGDGTYKLKLVALPKEEIVMVVADGVARAVMVIGGKKCYLLKVYVNSIERTMRLPKVEFIELWGVPVDGGDIVVERKNP